MKKLVALFLSLILLCSCCIPVLAEDDSTAQHFTTTLMQYMEYTASDYSASGINRALFTLLAMLEINAHDDSGVIDVTKNSFVGYDDDGDYVLALYYNGTEYIYAMYFTYLPTELYYWSSDGMTDSSMAEFVMESLVSTSYTNSSDDLLSVTEVLTKVLNDED